MSLVDLGKRLLEAAKQGETDEVRNLMSNGAPFTTDWLGTSPLHFAALHGHIDTAFVLLRAGISRDARTKVDRTPLHAAAQEGHLEIVELLLKSGADIEAKDMLKMSPLHWAVERGQLTVIDKLLQNGADISCQTKFDQSAVDIALRNGRTDIARVLQSSQPGTSDDKMHDLIHEPQIQEITEQVVEDDCAAEHIISEQIVGSATDHIISEQIVDSVDVDETAIITELPSSPADMSSSDILQGAQVLHVTDTGESGEDGEQSTEVLNTLAALAEASGPMNTAVVPGTVDLNWLESQGLTLISTTDSSGLISPGIEGQTLTLTEAGKLALSKYKTEEEPVDQTVILHDGSEGVFLVNTDDDQQHVTLDIIDDEHHHVVEEKLDIMPPRKRMKLQVIKADGDDVIASKQLDVRRKITGSLQLKHHDVS